MKDAGNEAKRATEIEMQRTTEGSNANVVLRACLGAYEAPIRATLGRAKQENVVNRIWDKDASLWKNEELPKKIIVNSLGWLTVAAEMLPAAAELEAFAEGVRASGEFRHVMVCGMGGSSLCPEVLRQTFGRQENFPALLVLDSTDPDSLSNFAQQIDIARCLFIVASKSGTTTEPLAFHKYWYNEVARKSTRPGQSFLAITDPGSQMADTAAAEGFRRIFLNQPDIGGRYSALSYFGMVPAAMMGLDIRELLTRAQAMGNACGASVAGDLDQNQNPGAILGAVMAECALAGRDKLTIVADPKISALGLWVEQLVAESTGKEGKGIVPVVGEPLGAVSTYAQDRLFVAISVGTMDGGMKSKLEALEQAGHPVVYRCLTDLYDLGAEFFLWEMATAFAGWRLAINPFDQANVQESKDATRALLEEFTREGTLPDPPPLAKDETLTIFGVQEESAPPSVAEVMTQHLAGIKPYDYVAVLAYVEETSEMDAALQAIRTTLRDATGCATTTGYGPRFLHSTGQLHKGGPDSGVFIQITAPDQTDLEIPGALYTFSVLKQAQAQGDFQSLLSHGRRALRVDLGADVITGLRKLRELIAQVLMAKS